MNEKNEKNANPTSSGVACNTSVATTITDKEPTCHFMKQVGWMIKFNDCKFQMLFDDGISVIIDAKDQTLVYKDSLLSFPQSFRIDRHLPEKAKAKLSFFPLFLKDMKS